MIGIIRAGLLTYFLSVADPPSTHETPNPKLHRNARGGYTFPWIAALQKEAKDALRGLGFIGQGFWLLRGSGRLSK